MKGILTIALFISLTACTKWYEVKEGNGVLYIDNVQSEIHSLKDVEWSVGQSKNKEISKGFVFKFDIPKLDEEGSEKLLKKYGIDSWIFRITKVTRGKNQILGQISYDFSNITRVSSDITVHIFYHAAAVSQTFRKFKCPAFNHRSKLNKYTVQDKMIGPQDIFSKRGNLVPGRIEKPSFAPVIFSGDISLVGNYIVEYALFNSNEKKIFSKWHQANNYVDIISEDRIVLPSCSGIKEENDVHNNSAPKPEEFRIN